MVLAKVALEADGKITRIDNCSCRRMVAAFGNFWWSCSGGAVESVQIEPVQPETPPPAPALPPPTPPQEGQQPTRRRRRT